MPSAPAEAAFAVTSAMSADPPASTRTLAVLVADRDRGEVAAEPNDDAANTAVADEHVASGADDPPRHPAPQAEAHQAAPARTRLRVRKASAGPPIFHEVYGASGSSKRTRVAENLAQRFAIRDRRAASAALARS